MIPEWLTLLHEGNLIDPGPSHRGLPRLSRARASPLPSCPKPRGIKGQSEPIACRTRLLHERFCALHPAHCLWPGRACGLPGLSAVRALSALMAYGASGPSYAARQPTAESEPLSKRRCPLHSGCIVRLRAWQRLSLHRFICQTDRIGQPCRSMLCRRFDAAEHLHRMAFDTREDVGAGSQANRSEHSSLGMGGTFFAAAALSSSRLLQYLPTLKSARDSSDAQLRRCSESALCTALSIFLEARPAT